MTFLKLCRLLFITMLALASLAGSGYAADRTGMVAGKHAKSFVGTWYSPEGAITFKADGTVNYEGQRYFYAFSNGGLLQLSRKGSNRGIPYQYSGGKLTLTVKGQSRVYTRR